MTDDYDVFIVAENVSTLKIDAENPDFNYLLALIYQGLGKIPQSNAIMQKLKANQ